MSPTTVAVRQNLDLLVDNGQPVPGLDCQLQLRRWGNTLGGAVHVWPSGIGVTSDGALVYVGGTGLSIVDLANLLVRAGAVRAMEMDINTGLGELHPLRPAQAGVPASATNGTLLTYDQQTSPPSRYFAPLSRDFFTMSVRPTTTPVSPSHYKA